MTTMTDARLREVFEMVQDKDNWKNSIDAVVICGAATRDEISEAVIYFTGSVPTITNIEYVALPHPSALVPMAFPAMRVVAAGYYAAIGA